MDNKYKKMINNQNLRLTILKVLRYVPSKIMVKLQYKMKLKRKLDIKRPKRFTEKIQLYKLSYKDKNMHICVDKYEVRKFIIERNLERILVECYGVYDSFEELDFKELPEKFVMKTTNSSQTNVLCKNKNDLDLVKIKSDFSHWLKREHFDYGREWAYKYLKPRIIVEELLVDNKNPGSDIKDYKFMCFDGKPEFIVYDSDRFSGHRRNIYDLEWNDLNIKTDCEPIEERIERPTKLDELIEIAKILSKGFPFVRVDLYYVNEKIYFGELTFYPWSGYVSFEPDEFDYLLGEKFVL